MTTLNAFLDLSVCPVSYDAVVFMAQAEMERRKIGAGRMHVSVVGEPRKKPQYDEHEAEWRLWNIVIPAAHLFGATVSCLPDMLYAERLASSKDWKNWPLDWRYQTLNKRHHLIGGVIARHKAGEFTPIVRASAHAKRKVAEWFAKPGLPVVTVTHRQTYLPERNTDPKVWDAARKVIIASGYAIVTLLDTDTALGTGRGYGELNLDLRAACYELAVLNLQANNGAASLCWFSDNDYVMFGAGVPEDEWRGLFVEQGLPLGESWPWARGYQRIAYGPTTAEQIIGHFEEWRASASATRS